MRLCLSVPAGRSWGRVPHVSDILEGPPCFASDEGQEPARNVGMRDASRHSLVHDDQGLWRQVQLSRGNWRREDAAGAIRSEDGGSR
jgi:hypothetical protein